MPAKPKAATHVYVPWPDPDATAPGGMSQTNLRVELAEHHGYKMDQTRGWSWKEMIDVVIESRQSSRLWWYVNPETGELYQASIEENVPGHKAFGTEQLAKIEGERQGWDYGDYEFTETEQPYDDEFLGQRLNDGPEPVVSDDSDTDDLDLDDEDEDDDDLDALDAMLAEAEASDSPALNKMAEGIREAQADIDADEDEVSDDLFLEAEAEADAAPEPSPAVARAIAVAEAAVSEKAAEPDDVEAWFEDVTTERDDFVAAMPAPLFLGMPGVNDYVFNGHAGTGPSASDRWLKCTASLKMARDFLEKLSANQQAEFSDANIAARQGTTAHAAAEVEARVMLGEMDAVEAENALFDLAIDPPAGEDYTPEMAQFITEYTDLIKQFIDNGHRVVIEQRLFAAVPLTAPLPKDLWADEEDPETGMYYVIPGSGDAVAYPTPEDRVLTVVDLKYGEGKDVDPEDNSQAMLYLLGALAELIESGYDIEGLDGLRVIIAQPRLGGIKEWTLSLDTLLEWRDEVLSPALTAALGLAPAEFSPGEDTCQWCPARGGCSALAAARVEAATELFDAIDEAEFGDGPGVVPTDLDNKRLGSLLEQIGGLVDLYGDLKAEAQRRMYRGQQVPGHVLVNYQPSRYWAQGAAESLEDKPEFWTAPQLMSPTQAIKQLSKEFPGKNAEVREAAAAAALGALVVKPERKPVVAKEGDRRSLWTGTPPDQMFTAMPDDDGAVD